MSTTTLSAPMTPKSVMKQFILEAIELNKMHGLPTTQWDVFKSIAEHFEDHLSDSDWKMCPADEGRANPYNVWMMTCTHAASELRAEGYLHPVSEKGGEWRTTGKGPYVAGEVVRRGSSTPVNPRANVCGSCNYEHGKYAECW